MKYETTNLKWGLETSAVLQMEEGQRAAKHNPEEESESGGAAALHKSNITKDMGSLSSRPVGQAVKRDLHPSFISELSAGKSMTLSPEKVHNAGKKATTRAEQQWPEERQPRSIRTSWQTR